MPIKSARNYNCYPSLWAAHLAAGESRRAAAEYIDPEDQFDFFGLPRELRNVVYDELLIGPEVEIPQWNGDITVKAENAPKPRHLLVNRQFQSELLERTRICTELLLKDSRSFDMREVDLPSGLSAARLVLDLRLGSPYLSQLVEDIRNLRDNLLSSFSAQKIPFELEVHMAQNHQFNDYLLTIADSLDRILRYQSGELATEFRIYETRRYWRAHTRRSVEVSSFFASYSHDTGRLHRQDGSKIVRYVTDVADL